MNSIVGLWDTFNRGEITSALERLFNYLTKSKSQVKTILKGDELIIKDAQQLFHELKSIEKKHGVRKLIDVLISGLELTCKQQEKNTSKVTILLRTPQGNPKDLEIFKNMITSWVETSDLSFMERFFKSSQALFLHTPLERGLKRKFGFQFQYKILITKKE